MINLSDLEAKAKAASTGQWTADDNIVFCDGESVALDCRHRDAAFIASMNPTTALALIRVARMAKDMYAVGEERKFLHTTRWDEIKEALKEIAE
jgi:hypothetical protein